jgi:hypothetical protein
MPPLKIRQTGAPNSTDLGHVPVRGHLSEISKPKVALSRPPTKPIALTASDKEKQNEVWAVAKHIHRIVVEKCYERKQAKVGEKADFENLSKATKEMYYILGEELLKSPPPGFRRS